MLHSSIVPSSIAPAVLKAAARILELRPQVSRDDAVQAARIWVAGSFAEVN